MNLLARDMEYSLKDSAPVEWYFDFDVVFLTGTVGNLYTAALFCVLSHITRFIPNGVT